MEEPKFRMPINPTVADLVKKLLTLDQQAKVCTMVYGDPDEEVTYHSVETVYEREAKYNDDAGDDRHGNIVVII